MKSVLQVSMVLREVAEISRVTLSPKKLKPLWGCQPLLHVFIPMSTHPIEIMISSEVMPIEG